MGAILFTGFIVFIAFGLRRTSQPEEQEEPEVNEEDLVFEEVQERVKRMHQTVHQLTQLEELITSLEICSPEEREQPIRLNCSAPNGSNIDYQFWADGRQNTRMLTDVAYSERHRLRTSLLEQITDLYDTVVTESVTERELVQEESYA